MNRSFNFIQLIAEYQKLKHISDIGWERGNHFSLSNANTELDIGYIPNTQNIVIVSYLGFINPDQRESVLSNLLLENFSGNAGMLGYFGLLSPEEVTLNFKSSVKHVDAYVFSDWVDQMCIDSKQCKKKLSLFNEQTEKNKTRDDILTTHFLRV